MTSQHSQETDQWFTPKEVISIITECLGYIDLDVCSSHAANLTVQADRFIPSHSIESEWKADTVYCNPPSGKFRGSDNQPEYLNCVNNKQLSAAFWLKLNRDFNYGRIGSFCYLAYNLEQLLYLPQYAPFSDCTIVIPKKRIKFVPGDGQKATSPSHGNALIFRGVGDLKILDVVRDWSTVWNPVIG